MREDRRVYVSSGTLSPDEVAGRTFALTFRGFDPTEVRTYLGRMADELRRAADRERDLRRQLADAEDRAAHPELDEPTLTRALGQEAARLLQTAHEAAADVRARAEESVAKLLREAHEQATGIRGSAETVLGERTAEAEAAAAQIRGSAEGEVAAVMDEARREAESMLEGVRAQCRDMVQEAQDLRAKVLNDLARRRKVVHTQVEQLRAGRDSLIESFREVRRALDHINEGLQRAESEARYAADTAVRRVGEEREPTPDELERDLAAEGASAASIPEMAVPSSGTEAAELGAPGGPAEAPATDEAEAGEPTAEEAAPAQAQAGSQHPAARAAAGVTEERRLSSLRILRRPRRGEAPPPPPGMTEVRPRSEEERVRIIEPGSAARSASEAGGAAEDAGAGDAVREGGGDGDGESAAVTVESGPRPSADDIFARMRAAQDQGEIAADDGADAGVEAETGGAGQPAHQAGAGGAEGAIEAGDGQPPSGTGVTEAPAHEERASSSADSAVPATEDGDTGAGEEDEFLLRRRDELLDPIQQRLARKLKRVVQDEQNDVLDRLRSYRGKPAVDVLLLSEEAQTARYADATRPLLEEAAAAGTRFGAGGQDGEAAAPDGAGVDEVARELAAAVGSAIRRKLERAAEQGGDDEVSMSDSVGAAYREWKGKRADRVAGDHLAAAFARGVLAATPEGVSLRWVVDDGEDRCPDCDDNALGGPTAKGEAYPTGQIHPPAHPGCRCILVPVNP